MKTVFIGAGNLAVNLATEMYQKGFDICQVYSRTYESADLLARQVDAIPISSMTEVFHDADLYIFSVPDSVLEQVIGELKPNNGLWVHTAGSISVSVFEGYVSRYGVIYPFQTFSKARSLNWDEIPIFIEASDEAEADLLKAVMSKLSAGVHYLSSDKRRYIHLSGVFACNFTNYMYYLADKILAEAGLSLDVALPLIDETCAKVHMLKPIDAQTGPAIRHDVNVMQKHVDLLQSSDMRQIYSILSESISHIKK